MLLHFFYLFLIQYRHDGNVCRILAFLLIHFFPHSFPSHLGDTLLHLHHELLFIQVFPYAELWSKSQDFLFPICQVYCFPLHHHNLRFPQFIPLHLSIENLSITIFLTFLLIHFNTFFIFHTIFFGQPVNLLHILLLDVISQFITVFPGLLHYPTVLLRLPPKFCHQLFVTNCPLPSELNAMF